MAMQKRHLLALAALATSLTGQSIIIPKEGLVDANPDGIELQQLARTISPAVDAPLALVIRNSAISFADEPSASFSDPPGCSLLRLQPLVAWVDALLIHIDTGEILWEVALPYGAHATPMSYRVGPDSKQYVVVAAGGNVLTEIGDGLRAYALPD